jgi:DNA-binding MurR/RpiR family transcriptional regulator
LTNVFNPAIFLLGQPNLLEFIMNNSNKISNTLQDYLEAVLKLTEQNDTVRITDLALYLQVAKPTVTETVKTSA